jgi:lipid-binding SYLF domain-containing protein
MKLTKQILLTLPLLSAALLLPEFARAGSASEIDSAVSNAAQNLYANHPTARALARKAKGILIFPRIVKAGFILGAQSGEGALRERGHTVAYYRTVAASYGLQAGVEEFGYALYFMDRSSLNYLKQSRGWEIGVGPNVVIVDQGFARSISTTTLQQGVYAYFFSQRGMMAGMGLQGSKIIRIYPR